MRRLALLVLCCGCPAPEPDDDPTDTGTLADPCDALTWDTVGAPMVLTWCTPCHGADVRGGQRSGAPAAIALDTEDDVRSLKAAIRSAMTDEPPRMPPAGGPDAEAVDRFVVWLGCLDEG